MREPQCGHKPTVRISSHEDLAAAVKTSDAIASVYCCDRQVCRDKLVFWIQGSTGRPAVVVPLRRVA
jgi:hypothetical protein